MLWYTQQATGQMKAAEMKRQASHISLLITNTSCLFAFGSITTTDVWTTTTAREMNNARLSNTKKIRKEAF